MNSVWNDPMVQEALKERSADDIAILSCPRCGKDVYYNEGSHFSCSACEIDFYVLGEGEEAPDGLLCVNSCETRTLSDCVDSCDDGP